MLDKESRRKNMGTNLKRQLKGLLKSEDNMANAIGFFVVAAILVVASVVTKMPFLMFFGGGCVLLGLERLVQRSDKQKGGEVSDLKLESEKLKEKAAQNMKKK